jgi:glutathione S-transferase
VNARLYVIALSNPAAAARAMLAYKRLPHRLVKLPAGFHPPLLRAAGFSGGTVPALELADGRRIQGSLAIPRVLDELIEERPLYPRDPAARRAVEAAERWGHAELQPVPRRFIRWALSRDAGLRRWLASEILQLPAPGLGALLGKPIATRMAAVSVADEARVRADVAQLPALLDRVDALLAAGTIGGDTPNAADFQILSTVRVLVEFADLAPLVARRPCAAEARRLFPTWDGPIPSTPQLSSE